MLRRGRKTLIAAGVLTVFLLAQVCIAQPLGPPGRDPQGWSWSELLSGLRAWIGAQAGNFTAIWAEEGSVPDPFGNPTGTNSGENGSNPGTDAGSQIDPFG